MDTLEFCRELTRRAESIDDRRALFREEMVRPGYSGGRHIAFTVLLTASVAAVAWAQVGHWGAASWLGVGTAILASMGVIYFGHRYPMHRSIAGLSPVYDMHTRCHHMLFDREHLEINTRADAGMVMLPKIWTLALSAVAFPLIALPVAVLSTDAAWAFLGCVQAYYLCYEMVHLAAHAPDDSLVHRLPVLGYLTAHHRHHHDWTVMHRKNFSMVIPVLDYVLGTREAPVDPPTQRARG